MSNETLNKVISSIYEVNILVGDINITDYFSFQECNIYESIESPIPYCEIGFVFPMGFINSNPELLADGTKITIKIKTVDDFKEFSIDESYVFRLSGISNIKIQYPFASLVMYGIFDCYKIFEDGNKYNGNVTSSQLINNIANDLELIPNVDITDDKQLWVAGEKNTRDFISYVCKHGYSSETSGMFWAIDRNRNLLYKDISNIFNSSSNIRDFKAGRGISNDNVAFYSDIETDIENGENNLKYSGYGGSDFYFDLLSYDWKEAAAKKVLACNNSLNINVELSKGLNSSWPGFDFGNLHPKYYQASRQNTRILATFATVFDIKCQFLQKFNLGEVYNVTYEYLKGENGNTLDISSFNAKAIVKSIQTRITQNGVSCLLKLTAQGLNFENNTGSHY